MRPLHARRATAYHEAGHAAVHHHFGHQIELISIQPDPESGSLGHARSSLFNFYGINRRDLRRVVREHVIASYAGFEAEVRVSPYADREVSAGVDESIAFNLPREFEVFPRGCSQVGDDGYWRWLEQRRKDARRLVRSIWPSIEIVASALLEKETLTGDQLAHLF